MGEILNELLSSIKSNDNLEQLRIICDQISKEENEKQEYLDVHPKGPRILLSLEVPGNTNKEIGFLTLELEDEDVYIIRYYTLQYRLIKRKDEEDQEGPRLKQMWLVGDHRSEKVLKKYAEKMKMLEGK